MSVRATSRPAVPTPRQIWALPGILALVILVLDQVTKYWIVQTLGPTPGSRQIFLIGDWLSFVYVQNTGIAFGLFRGFSAIFTVTALVISAGVLVAYRFYLPHHSLWVKVCIGLILGGALGNVLDRIRLNFVVDFIKVGWWPTFNVADSAISVGVMILAVYLLLADDIEPFVPRQEDDALLHELLSHDIPPRES